MELYFRRSLGCRYYVHVDIRALSPRIYIPLDFNDFIYNNFNDFTSKRYLFLVGDFNINILNNNNNNKYFLNSIYSLGSYPLISKPT